MGRDQLTDGTEAEAAAALHGVAELCVLLARKHERYAFAFMTLNFDARQFARQVAVVEQHVERRRAVG
jgi:hypothetical protein